MFKEGNKRSRESGSDSEIEGSNKENKKQKEEESEMTTEQANLELYEESMKSVNKRVIKDLKKEVDEWKATFFAQLRIDLSQVKKDFMADMKNEIDLAFKREKENIVQEVVDRIKSEKSTDTDSEAEMKAAVKKLQWRAEVLERKEKKNNVIISGVKFNYKSVKEEAKMWIKNKLQLELKIKEAWKIADEVSVIVCESYEDKVEIMSKKSLLKGTSVFINEDCTKKERLMRLHWQRMKVKRS